MLDTCALSPAYLRDTLLRLANAGTFRPLWSTGILDELQRNLADRTGPERARRATGLLRQHFPDANITGYEPLITAMANDAKDRHVLAVVVRADADVIVTFNLDDFPDHATEPSQIDGYRDPTTDLFGLAAALAPVGCPGPAADLRLHITPA